jgi:hypothetical protein
VTTEENMSITTKSAKTLAAAGVTGAGQETG